MSLPNELLPVGLLGTGAAAAEGYSIERSVRFNSADSAYLSRTPSTAGNRKTWTWAGWVKRSGLGGTQTLWGAYTSGTNETAFRFSGDTLEIYYYTGSFQFRLITTQVFRDPSAWYHFVITYDTTSVTADDRIKLYVNGTQVTQFSTRTNPAPNLESVINSAINHEFARRYLANFYLADVHFLDGQTPGTDTDDANGSVTGIPNAEYLTDFGEFDDNGIWQPIEYTGGYGLVSVADATGAKPILNTTDTYGAVKGTGTRADTNASSLVLALPLVGNADDVSNQINSGSTTKTVTANGAAASSTYSNFYGGSFYLSGTAMKVTASSDFDFGTGDFTVEFWTYKTSYGRFTTPFMIAPDSSTMVTINMGNNINGWNFYAGGYGLDVNNSFTASLWTHLAMSRQGSTVRCFINGILAGSFTSSGNAGSSSYSPAIGDYRDDGQYSYNGYLQDLRIYKGVAKYTSNFTPVVSSNNSFHLPFDDNSTAAALGTDTSPNGNDWTVNNILAGGLKYSDYLFNTGTNTVVSTNSGSRAAVFDGSTSTNLVAVTGDMTFSPPSAIPASSVTVYAYGSSNYPNRIYVNGTLIVTLTTNTSVTTSVASLTSVRTQRVNTADSANLAAIVVDGSILVDANDKDNDSLVDVPTNGTETDTGLGGQVRGNYCTLNPLNKSTGTLSNGNLDYSISAIGSCRGTMMVSSGKWYFEVKLTASGNPYVGIAGVGQAVSGGAGYVAPNAIAANNVGDIYYRYGGSTTYPGKTVSIGTGTIGVAIDVDNKKIWWSKNGTWYKFDASTANLTTTISEVEAGNFSTSFSNLEGDFFTVHLGNSTSNNTTYEFNAGQRPFAYTAPSGFKALCTANLDAPLVTKPSEYMDIALYQGNGTSQTISGLDFIPDFLWIKMRSSTQSHRLFDQIRGVSSTLFSNLTNAENTSYTELTSFNSDGFTVQWNQGQDGTNENNQTYVAWTWDAGDSTVTNTDGSITSSVRANPSAGFSIVTYTGNGILSATVGHGLGVTPKIVIIKSRTDTKDWIVYTTAIDGSYDFLRLNTTAAKTDDNAIYAPTSSIINPAGSSVNSNGQNYVAYCFAPVEGYSAFGSYTGNGSADGPFVYTGHRSRWILIKRTDSTGNWNIYDTQRNLYNTMNLQLLANASDAENTTTGGLVDTVSNGFKIRGTGTTTNDSGGTYIYAAFAESPVALNNRAR